MKKYVVNFYNNYTDKVEFYGDYDTEEELWAAIEGQPELDFFVSVRM